MSSFGPVDPALLSGDRGPSIVAVAVIGIVISILAVVMRFWSRAVASNVVLWWDDWAMLMTVVFSHVLLALSIWLTTVGLGKHKVAIPMQHIVPQFHGQRISLVFYSATIWGIKISALLLYGRLQMSRSRKIAVTGVLLIGYSSAFLSFARFVVIVIRPTILSAGPTSDPSWDLVPLLYLSMLEGPLAIIALCGPAIHQLLTRAINFGSLASLFTSRGRGTGKKSSGNSSGHQAAFSKLKGSGDVNTWPLATIPSTSSGTAINTPTTYPQKTSNDNLDQFSPRPMENLGSAERYQGEKQMV